ncbi:16S rRNA (adenine(1518)-N(6)/adenine(1519)-N(6))-dimethyltransferase RsmA [Pelagibacteraceae bacterium]|nr:16S rRNA (adenine(1518)-N(6)/adenine(1519)-N(6))-dimethyltransferase RsmA [Pelagibacteraceae bacterium]
MIKLKKSLGQNFLIDKNVLNKVVSSGSVSNKHVLEIGPGSGNLTNEIINLNPKTLTLIEKDERLYSILKDKLNSHKKIIIFNNDILKFDLEKNVKKNTTVFGNLPYNISTQILVKFIKFSKWPPKYDRLVLMFQKEVADKILADYNTSNYGRLTVISNWRLKIVKHFDVSRNCFHPKPKVESTVLIFEPITNKKYNIKNIENLEKITQIFFSTKRKMVNKAMNKAFNFLKTIPKEIKINLKCRPSEIRTEDYFYLTEIYEKYKKKLL